MVEKATENLQANETTKKHVVGLKLQDVILRANTQNEVVLLMREKLARRIELNPNEGERISLLEVLSQNILNSTLEQAKKSAKQVLIPYHSTGERRKALIISSASSASGAQEAECGILQTHGHAIDIPGAIEGRDTGSARNNDTTLISTEAGLKMARAKKNVKVIDLANEVVLESNNQVVKGSDIYYKADGLLLLILTNPESSVISSLSRELADKPLVYLYNLDEETQIALLWLAQRAGVLSLQVNANSSEVAVELTKKSFKYPTVEQAINIPNYEDPFVMQKEEWKLSQAAIEIDHQPDCVPGYLITRASTQQELYVKSLTALMLLNTRYGLCEGWIKPDRGTDGGNQSGVAIELTTKGLEDRVFGHLKEGDVQTALGLYKNSLPNLSEINSKIQEMWDKGGDWVVEAKTNYFKIKFPIGQKERAFMTTPSVHVIKGEPRNTISLQLVDGTAWGGNLICSHETWVRLVGMIEKDTRIANNSDMVRQLEESYVPMTQAMKDYVRAVNKSVKYQGGQVRGGADLAIATLGGKFGNDRVVVAVQDYNARANGCETAYALYDQAKEIYGEKGEAVTRNLTPMVNFDIFSCMLPKVIETTNAIYGKNINLEQVKLIAVSAGWGQIGVIGTDAIEIMQNVLLLEEQFRDLNMIR